MLKPLALIILLIFLAPVPLEARDRTMETRVIISFDVLYPTLWGVDNIMPESGLTSFPVLLTGEYRMTRRIAGELAYQRSDLTGQNVSNSQPNTCLWLGGRFYILGEFPLGVYLGGKAGYLLGDIDDDPLLLGAAIGVQWPFLRDGKLVGSAELATIQGEEQSVYCHIRIGIGF